MKQKFKVMIELNNEFAKCSTSLPVNPSIKVLGITNGKCHFYYGFIEANGKELPTNDCYVLMNVLRQEIQKQNQMYANGRLEYNSANDCK